MSRPTTRQIAVSILISSLVFALAWLWDDLEPWLRACLVGLLALAACLVYLTRKPRVEMAHDPLPAVLDEVIAEQSKRPWLPTQLPWAHIGPGTRPILLVPAADYHLAEIVPLASELEKRGYETRIAVGESPWSRTRAGLATYPGLDVFALPDANTVSREISLVVTMKDTGSMTEWVTDVRKLGIPVVGKVEGAQDFWDADTPEERRPYRNLDLVLCQGQFDADALSDRETAIVGSTRLERLWWAPPAEPPAEPLALINLNFVYGVRTADRKLWLETAIRGCEQAGVPYVISVHPAERTALGQSMTRVSASTLLPLSSLLISRFSTVPFEAMARGVPFVYHNPHREIVRTFQEPQAHLPVSTTPDELAAGIQQAVKDSEETRDRTLTAFGVFISTFPHETSERRASDAVEGLLRTQVQP